jgi:hypothetical protein
MKIFVFDKCDGKCLYVFDNQYFESYELMDDSFYKNDIKSLIEQSARNGNLRRAACTFPNEVIQSLREDLGVEDL